MNDLSNVISKDIAGNVKSILKVSPPISGPLKLVESTNANISQSSELPNCQRCFSILKTNCCMESHK